VSTGSRSGRWFQEGVRQRTRVLGREVIVDTRPLAVAAAVVLSLAVLASCGGGTAKTAIPGNPAATTSSSRPTSTPTSSPSSAPGPVPALQTHNPTVAVAPATGLFDDEEVLVTVTGFGIGGKVWLSECAAVSDANDQGCGEGVPEQTLLVTNPNGSGSVAFQIRSSAAARSNDLTDIASCVNTCVLVATVGGGYGFGFTNLHFVGSAPPNCKTAQLHVSAGETGAATGHSGFPVLFTNTSSSACRMSGYPGVALLDAAGRQVIQAQREPSGFMGGLPGHSAGPLPAIGLASGETASALVEGDDVPLSGVAPCGPFAAILVTPPNATQSVRVDVGVPGCSDFQVHPVVLSATGQG